MNIMKSFLLAAVSVAATTGAGSFTANASTLVAGGSSLVGPYVARAFDCFGAYTNTAPSVVVTDLPFIFLGNACKSAALPQIEPSTVLSYDSVGSGNGVKGITFHNAAQYGTGRTGAPAYSGSDNPITAADLAQFVTTGGGTLNANNTVTGGAYGNLVQIPEIVAPVTVSFSPTYIDASGTVRKFNFKNAPTTKSVVLKTLKLRMTAPAGVASVCSIATGVTKDWFGADMTAANGGVSLRAVGDTTASLPIKLVGRADKSGTTQLFTRALANQCGSTIYPTLAGDSTIDVSGINGRMPAGTAYTLVSGSGGVVGALQAGTAATVNGGIGYVGPDFVLPAVLALVPATTTTVISADLINSNNNIAYSPNAANAVKAFAALATATPAFGLPAIHPLPATIDLNPLDYVPTNLNSAVANPATNYPIFGTSQIDAYTCYADATLAASVVKSLKLLEGSLGTTVPLNKVFTDAVNGIAGKAGLGSLPATWQAFINKTYLSGGKTGISGIGASSANVSCKTATGA